MAHDCEICSVCSSSHRSFAVYSSLRRFYAIQLEHNFCSLCAARATFLANGKGHTISYYLRLLTFSAGRIWKESDYEIKIIIIISSFYALWTGSKRARAAREESRQVLFSSKEQEEGAAYIHRYKAKREESTETEATAWWLNVRDAPVAIIKGVAKTTRRLAPESRKIILQFFSNYHCIEFRPAAHCNPH